MELTAAVRLLLARRRLVAAGLGVAILVGVLLVEQVSLGLPPKLQSRQHYVGEASAMVLVDTPNSQIVDVAPTATFDPTALYNQASLLADLVATAPVDQAIASSARIPGEQLLVTPPTSSVGTPIRATPLGVSGTRAAAAGAVRWLLKVTLDPNLPIIALDAVAPDPSSAARLADAAIAVLSSHLAAIAAAQHLPKYKQAVVNPIQPPIAASVARGPRKIYGLAATIVVFLLICFAIVVADRIADRRAEAVAAEDGAVEEAGLVPGYAGSPSRIRTAPIRGLTEVGKRTVVGARGQRP